MFPIVNMIETFSKARQSKARQKVGFNLNILQSNNYSFLPNYPHVAQKQKRQKSIRNVMISYIKHNTQVPIRTYKE